MEQEQLPTNQTTIATQMGRDPSHITSYTINSLSIRRRQNQRRLGHRITLNFIRQLRNLPRQNVNDPFADQIFNGSEFY
ncbi:hypothetical protein RclHR1_14160006 [Rhizophagus clarus]|uniref:Uncharacterized protein n=1 Tax=Rhizophagus clarus TaxID=94130 RepID=A0A2Z6QBV8_9GLOM|nr:hypothetical protein RclHR1_14160006 [Rhizophagus clarus]GES84989.1 hypothetical protein GLOIN_2v1835724 [Rhizophagus clarus]